MWIKNENFPKTIVIKLEKLHKFGIQNFFIWAKENRENFSLPRGPWEFRICKYVPTSISLCVFAAARPYAAGGPRPRRVRGHLGPGRPLRTPGCPLGLSSRLHASLAPWHGDTPPTMRRATSSGRHLATERVPASSTSPRRPLASPRHPLAYK